MQELFTEAKFLLVEALITLDPVVNQNLVEKIEKFLEAMDGKKEV